MKLQNWQREKKIFTISYFTGKDQVFDIFGLQSWLAQKNQTTDLILSN